MDAKKRSFQDKEYFEHQENEPFFLMPFNFHRVSSEWEVLVNLVGDFLVVPHGTAEKIVKRKLSENTHPEIYEDLLANFFISEEPIHPLIDVLATRYRTKKSFLYQYTSLHIFVVTLRCEHTCEYCQVSRVTQNKEAFDMKIKHLEKGVDFMLMSPSKQVTMEFQGGEPLLAFDLVKHGIEYAKAKSIGTEKALNFVICTNLSLINEEMLSFCRVHDVMLSASLDGPSSVHNQNRRRPGNNSYEAFKKGLELSRKFLETEKIGALMTTSKLSLSYPIEIVNSYIELGFNNIFLRPINPYGFAIKNPQKSKYDAERFIEFYKEALQYIIELNKRGTFFIEDFTAILLKKMFTPFPTGFVDLQSPAGLINSVIVFNYDGEVYTTDEARMLAEMGDKYFRLGDLEGNTYQEIFYGPKAQEISKFWLNENLPGCADCAFQVYCGADPVKNYATQGNLVGFRPTNGFCIKNMEIIRYLFEIMIEDPETENIFRSWIN